MNLSCQLATTIRRPAKPPADTNPHERHKHLGHEAPDIEARAIEGALSENCDLLTVGREFPAPLPMIARL